MCDPVLLDVCTGSTASPAGRELLVAAFDSVLVMAISEFLERANTGSPVFLYFQVFFASRIGASEQFSLYHPAGTVVILATSSRGSLVAR